MFDVFSHRRLRSSEQHELDDLSEQLRNRIFLLYREIASRRWDRMGNLMYSAGDLAREFWGQMHNALQHSYGRLQLSNERQRDEIMDTIDFMMNCATDEFFDFIELSFKLDVTGQMMHEKESDVVEAINEIFRVENAPYKLTPIIKTKKQLDHYGHSVEISAYPRVIHIEDEAIYSQAIAPALSVLSAPHLESASIEFRDAMDDYRKGKYGDCLTKCGSALESVLKVLCQRNRWSFNETDTLAPLLKVVVDHSSLDSFFRQPLMLIATIRNRLSSSHGAGSSPRVVEQHIAQYAVSSTAAAIVLLVHETNK